MWEFGLVSCIPGLLLYVGSRYFKERGDRLNSIKQFNSIADIKRLPENALPLLAAVRGQVWANDPLTPRMQVLRSIPAVIISLKAWQLQGVLDCSCWSWYNLKYAGEDRREAFPWCLEDASESRLPILESQHADPLELDKVGPTWTPALPSEWRFVGERLKERSLGVLVTEDILPVGAKLTAIGELAPHMFRPGTVPDGAIPWGDRFLVLQVSAMVQKPRGEGDFILTRQTVEEVVSQIRGNARLLLMGAGALLSLGVILLAAPGVKALFRMHQRRVNRRRIEEARRGREGHLEPIGQAQGDAIAAALLGPEARLTRIEEAPRQPEGHLEPIGQAHGDATAAALLGPDTADTVGSASSSRADAVGGASSSSADTVGGASSSSTDAVGNASSSRADGDDAHLEQNLCVACYTNRRDRVFPAHVEQNLCVACYTSRCDTVFPSCGHVCTCRGCSERLDSCPVCRAPCKAIRLYHIGVPDEFDES